MEEQAPRRTTQSFHEDFDNKGHEVSTTADSVPSGSVSDLSPELDGISIQENTGSTLRSSSVVIDQSQPEQSRSSRIRSSSFNDHDLTEQTSKGVNPNSQRAGTTSSSSSVEGSRDRTERSVQLNTREVKALKMVTLNSTVTLICSFLY